MATGADIFKQVIVRGGLGYHLSAADVDDLTSTTITSGLWFRNTNWGTNHLMNLEVIIFRPDASSSVEYIRYAGELTPSTGAITLDTPYATDTTKTSETFYVLFNGVHPQWIVDAMNRALDKTYFENSEPLSAKPSGTTQADAGFQSTATSSYTESDADGGAATTFTKITTANSENVYTGIGSGRVLNAAAGGYIRQRFNVTPGEQISWWTLSRLDSGTNAEAVLRDISNGAFIGTTVEHAQEAWQWMQRLETVPSGCKILETRHQGEGTTDDVYWNASVVLFPERARYILDTKWDSANKVPALVSLQPNGTSVGSNVWAADAFHPVEIPPSDYDFQIERPGANPYALVFHNGSQRHWCQWPVIIQGRRSYSDLTTFSLALTETSGIDVDLADAATRVELFRDQRVSQRVTEAETRLADSYGDFLSISRQFETEGPAQRKKPLVWSGTPN